MVKKLLIQSFSEINDNNYDRCVINKNGWHIKNQVGSAKQPIICNDIIITSNTQTMNETNTRENE